MVHFFSVHGSRVCIPITSNARPGNELPLPQPLYGPACLPICISRLHEYLSLHPVQANELYGGRAHVTMDRERLLRGASWGLDAGADTPDFLTRIHPSPQEPPSAVSPLAFHEVAAMVQRGSDATSLDELPRCVLRFCQGSGIAALCHFLNSIRAGHPTTVFNSVLHLPLRKKDPSWLLRNSRPVLLEPFVRRLEASIIYRRLMHHLESRGGVPSNMFAYRRQMPPQHAALLLRWLIAYWASSGASVHMGDWDERDAFCNIPRTDASPLLNLLYSGFGSWVEDYYSEFAVHVAQSKLPSFF